MVSVLLDGPQLASRWTARYASVLADDPGSAVLTLTSAGMVRRCRPAGCATSNVVALWKDATGELTEIALEDDAAAVLISTTAAGCDSYTADGRRHPGSASTLTLSAVHPIRFEARRRGDRPQQAAAEPDGRSLPPLDERELSKATSWAEAVAEAAFADPGSLPELMDAATAGDWRAALGLPPPTRMFVASVVALRDELSPTPTLDAVFTAAHRLAAAAEPTAIVTGVLLEIALEQRLAAEVAAGRTSPAVLAELTGQMASRRGITTTVPSGSAWTVTRTP